jgi:hypothetical protein
MNKQPSPNAMMRKIKGISTLITDFVKPQHTEMLSHSWGQTVPSVDALIVPDLEPESDDIKISERLIGAYQRCVDDERAEGQYRVDLWSHIRELQSAFLAILNEGDPVSLAAYLCNMSRHDATIGTVQGNHEYQRLRRSRRYRNWIALLTKDKLISLAEAVGVLSCENPEQGRWGANLHLDSNCLVEQIAQVVGIDIAPPPVDGGLLKIRTSQGLFNERDLNAIFTAWSLKGILPEASPSSLCEIGAGSGRVAYWSWRFGFRDYTIFDLPHINVIQGYYLLKSLPDVPIHLYGEENCRDKTVQGIEILPYYKIGQAQSGRFELVLNQDSFPEIHEETVRAYLAHIKQISRRYFLSINHESQPPSVDGGLQVNVPENVAATGGYRRISRTPYWLRLGYVTELYEICG